MLRLHCALVNDQDNKGHKEHDRQCDLEHGIHACEQGGILPIEVGCHICGDIVNEMQQHRNDDVARLEIDDRKGKSDGP